MTPKENLLRVIRHDHPEYVPLGLGNTLREITFDVLEWPEEPGFDAWGVRWEVANKEIGAYPVEHPLKSLDDLAGLAMPDFTDVPYQQVARDAFVATDRDSFLLMGRVGETLFERAWMLMGMEGLMLAFYEGPDKLKELFARIAAVRSQQLARHVAAGCEAVIFADDYGGQEGMLISPAQWREFVKPHLAALYKQASNAGMLIVQHSCGNNEPILADLVEMGLNVWHPCQPTSNDLAALKQRFAGRLTFYGAINSYVLDRGSPDDVRAEVRLRIRQLAAGGGFIAAPSHGVPYRKENIDAMADEVSRVGRYGSDAFNDLFR